MGKYSKVVYYEAYEVDGDNCVKCGVWCKQADLHHVLTKSRGGTKLVKVCRECHAWIGNNIKQAAKLGLYEYGYNTTK